jgi:hypothetical protein
MCFPLDFTSAFPKNAPYKPLQCIAEASAMKNLSSQIAATDNVNVLMI